MNILIILASTREGRAGEKVAQWVEKLAMARSDFASELVDLRDWPLPSRRDLRTTNPRAS